MRRRRWHGGQRRWSLIPLIRPREACETESKLWRGKWTAKNAVLGATAFMQLLPKILDSTNAWNTAIARINALEARELTCVDPSSSHDGAGYIILYVMVALLFLGGIAAGVHFSQQRGGASQGSKPYM